VNPVAHAAILVARHDWEGERHVPKVQALVSQFPHEAQSAAWIVWCVCSGNASFGLVAAERIALDSYVR
jgi:hypothetical protein